MKIKITIILLMLSASFAFGDSFGERIVGEWAVSSGGKTTAVLRFLEDGDVVNVTVDEIGQYRILEDDRLMIEFPDGIILGEVKFVDGRMFLTGSFSASQPLSLSLSEVTPEKASEAKASMDAMQSQLEEYIKSMESVKRDSQRMAIRNNLRQIAAAAQQYMLESGESEVRMYQIIGKDKYILNIKSVNGEEYGELVVNLETSTLSVTDADGEVHSYGF